MTFYDIFPLLSLAGFAGLGVLVIRQRRKALADRLFLVICILGTILYGDVVVSFFVKNPETRLAFRRVGYVFLVYLFPVYLHFFYAYLGVTARRWVIPATYGAAFCLMWVAPSPLFITKMKPHFFGLFPLGGPLYLLFGLFSLVSIGYALWLTASAIGEAKTATRKNQLKYLLAGFGLLGLFHILSFLPVTGFSVFPAGNLSFIALIIFGMGMFKHDLMDWGGLVRKGLVTTIVTSVIACGYLVVVVLARQLLKGYEDSYFIPFSILFILAAAISFGPINTMARTIVDRFFFAGKYDYQKTLKHVSRTIISVLDIHEVVRQITSVIQEAMQVETAILYLGKPSGSGFKNYAPASNIASGMPVFFENSSNVVKVLKKCQKTVSRPSLEISRNAMDRAAAAEMAKLKTELAIPLMLYDRLNGFLFLGEKKSGDIFSGEDMDLLETMSVQGALAVENARAYGEIAELNRDLEKKVADRTHDLKLALEEKEKTQAQLVRSESLAAIGQLVAGTAHELNNPLASVSSILQSSVDDLRQVTDHPVVDTDFVDDLAFARKQLARASGIVKSLLDLSRQTQTYAEPVNMNAVIEDALQILSNQFKHNKIEIIKDCATDLPVVQGNFSNLGQVILNIVRNSLQVLEKSGGRIDIQTRQDHGRGQVVVECRDNGPGVPLGCRQDIFKPFYTTKPVGKGTGLGLYISHEIIKKHNGELSVGDNNGRGAKFVIRLPLKKLDPLPAGPL